MFGVRGIYSTALCEPQRSTIMVWSILSQVLRDGKEASRQAAVARVVSYCQLGGQEPPTAGTGDYCKARAKSSEAAVHSLSCEVAAQLEEGVDEGWLFKGWHAKLIDGFTFTMPDTPESGEGEAPAGRGGQALGDAASPNESDALRLQSDANLKDRAVEPDATREPANRPKAEAAATGPAAEPAAGGARPLTLDEAAPRERFDSGLGAGQAQMGARIDAAARGGRPVRVLLFLNVPPAQAQPAAAAPAEANEASAPND